VIRREERELNRRQTEYRGDRPWPDLRGWTVILVDDGLATGATMRAAVAALKQQSPERVIVAVPVGASETCATLEEEADELICLERPSPFRAVGFWYDDFDATTDEEVHALLAHDTTEPAVGTARGV